MSKKHDEPEEVEKPAHLPSKPGRPVHPDHDLPQPPARPDQELPPHPRPTGPAPDAPHDAAPPMVGRVQFEDASGGDNGAAIYRVPSALRERVLTWRHIQHEQNHVNADGVWVYRQTHTSAAGALERDKDLEPVKDGDA